MIKLLMIEDDRVDQMGFERLVRDKRLAYDYAIVGSIAEAGRIIKGNQLDIIVTDYRLCDGTAVDVFELAQGVPIIVITGQGDEKIAVKVMKMGAYDYLIKDNERDYLQLIPIVIEKAISYNKTVEREMLDVEERERRRLGRDLHDSLGQLLTGIAFKSEILYDDLRRNGMDESAQAADIVALVNDAISQTRALAGGALIMDSDGAVSLGSALNEMALNVSSIYGISCAFDGQHSLEVNDESVITHLYRIAQEAVNNCVKHSGAKTIEIGLQAENDTVVLTVRDNGVGIKKSFGMNRGLGLRTMHYRARIIGAELSIAGAPGGGMLVTCSLERGDD